MGCVYKMGLDSIQKVSRNGDALIIVIPKKIEEILGLKAGDYINITYGDIVKKAEERKEIKEKRRLPEI